MENLTVVIPYWNGRDTIGRLLGSLPDGLPVIIVDDQSDEPLHLNKSGVRVMRLNERGYFSGAVNAGVDACETDVLVLNQDVWFEGERWLSQLAEMRHHAIAGDGVNGHPAWPAGYVHGTFMYLRRDVWKQVGPLDAIEYPLWGATCEWQLRAVRAGYSFCVYDVEGMGHDRSETKLRGAGQRFGEAITEAIRRERDKVHLFLRTPPAVSVIIPCHNYGKYLQDAINSLLGGDTCLGTVDGQTFNSWEAIIVDDASTDDSWEVAQSLADRSKGIRALRMSHNKGTPKALNVGIERSFGGRIQILSADDMLEPWCLERHYHACRDNPRRVIYGNLQIIKDGERVRELKLPTYDCDLVLNKNPMSAGLMYPKRAWRDAGGYPEVMRWGREDWAFNVALMRAGWCGVHIDDAGYLYRRERQNRSLRTGNKHKDEVQAYDPTPDGTPTWRGFFHNQLRELFPRLYDGRQRMPGCCGGGRGRRRGSAARPRANNPAPAAQQALPGKGGMERLEYIGKRSDDADSSWWGPVTNTRYAFGNRRKIGYVDTRDVKGMLAMQKEGKPVFKVYVPPKKPQSPPPPAPERDVLNIIDMKVVDIKALNIAPEQVPALLRQERGSKKRKTVIAHLKGLIDAS